MARYLDTSGKSTLGVALCARCSRKFALEELYSDPNSPNLMVCKDDLDQYDPYRLAPRPADKITLPFVRPDTPLSPDQYGLISQTGEAYIITEDGDGFLYAKKKF